jgi:hypothetical protein
MATLRFPRLNEFAVRYLWNDSMQHSIFPRTFSSGIKMEPARLRGALRCRCVRLICAYNTRDARAASADSCVDATREDIFACLIYLCRRAELGVLAPSLAQFLECSGSIPIVVDRKPEARATF